MTLTFNLRTSKCIQLFYMSLSIDRQNWNWSDEKRQRNRVTQVGPIFKDCLLLTLTFVLWPRKCIGILHLLMSIHQPSFMKIGWKMTEKSRLPVFLLCVLVTLTSAQVSSRSDEKWQKSRLPVFLFCVLVSLTFGSQKVYSSSTSHYLSSGLIWERSDNKWQRNREIMLG